MRGKAAKLAPLSAGAAPAALYLAYAPSGANAADEAISRVLFRTKGGTHNTKKFQICLVKCMDRNLAFAGAVFVYP